MDAIAIGKKIRGSKFLPRKTASKKFSGPDFPGFCQQIYPAFFSSAFRRLVSHALSARALAASGEIALAAFTARAFRTDFGSDRRFFAAASIAGRNSSARFSAGIFDQRRFIRARAALTTSGSLDFLTTPTAPSIAIVRTDARKTGASVRRRIVLYHFATTSETLPGEFPRLLSKCGRGQ